MFCALRGFATGTPLLGVDGVDLDWGTGDLTVETRLVDRGRVPGTGLLFVAVILPVACTRCFLGIDFSSFSRGTSAVCESRVSLLGSVREVTDASGFNVTGEDDSLVVWGTVEVRFSLRS